MAQLPRYCSKPVFAALISMPGSTLPAHQLPWLFPWALTRRQHCVVVTHPGSLTDQVGGGSSSAVLGQPCGLCASFSLLSALVFSCVEWEPHRVMLGLKKTLHIDSWVQHLAHSTLSINISHYSSTNQVHT